MRILYHGLSKLSTPKFILEDNKITTLDSGVVKVDK